ncbi:MAG TPA: DEAD/DEAH box helicase [Candidatus Wunengus sp. YC60]|uniref:DEAD/DEAH box helicase n=1 Tax=Candidatus Wunengus sp. YC60 TaxID=3367697 RepID=UPI0040270FB4
MNDVTLTRDNKILFYKKLWADSELLMARCFNFDINIDTGTIACDPKVTSIKAIKAFIELCFRNFNESPIEANRKQSFFMQLEVIKAEYDAIVDKHIASKLPYADKFYPHQSRTIKDAFFKQYNFFALDRRLGKTIISASLSRLWQCKRTVIVSPSTAKWNAWFRDLTKKFGFNELFFTIYDASRTKSIKAFNERFVVINYDIVGKFAKELCEGGIDHFIFDEAHKLKNRSTNRTKIIKEIIAQFPNARISFLSGTPVANRVDDLFSYLNLIGHELGKSYKKFLDDFTTSTSGRGGNRVTGGRNLDYLNTLISNFMIRVRKEDCLNMPPQTFTSYKFELDDYRTDYDKVIKELSERKEMSSLTGNLHSLNIITSKAKMKGIIELAEDILENGEKVVIFSNYTEPIEMLEAHFKGRCVKITGSVNAYNRDGIIEKFRTDPAIDVFLGNMMSAGEGINLAIANEVIIVDYPFVTGTLYQAIDRCLEIGKTAMVNVNYTFCEDSVDEYIYSILTDKAADINTVIDNGKSTMMQENITEVLIKKLLNRNDTTDDKSVVSGETVQEAKKESLSPVSEMREQSKNDGQLHVASTIELPDFE